MPGRAVNWSRSREFRVVGTMDHPSIGGLPYSKAILSVIVLIM
ncbi:MAG: hypothetical protein ACFFB3_06800 [Candidatus Hodarchaeota archaeon]